MKGIKISTNNFDRREALSSCGTSLEHIVLHGWRWVGRAVWVSKVIVGVAEYYGVVLLVLSPV